MCVSAAGRCREPVWLTVGMGAQELFNNPVFKGMEGNDGQSSTRRQQDFGGFEALLELAKFVVDVNADGLESLCRRVGFGIAPYRDRCCELCLPVPSSGSTGLQPRAATMARAISPSLPILAVLIDNVGEDALLGLVNHVSGGATVLPLAHIERSVVSETEPPVGVIQLHRRNPKIKGNAIDDGDAAWPRMRAMSPNLPSITVSRPAYSSTRAVALLTALGSRSTAQTRQSAASRIAREYPPAPKVPSI